MVQIWEVFLSFEFFGIVQAFALNMYSFAFREKCYFDWRQVFEQEWHHQSCRSGLIWLRYVAQTEGKILGWEGQ